MNGGTGVYHYHWSGDCSGGCFVTNQTSHIVVGDALHSTDSGVYSCAVIDDAGNTGNNSLAISVRGTVSVEFRSVFHSNCCTRDQAL